MIRRAIRKTLLPSCIAALTATFIFASQAPPPHGADPSRPPAPEMAPGLAPARSGEPSAHANPGEARSTVPRGRTNVAVVTGMVVARDPETGELGMPTPDQMRAIRQQRAEVLRRTPEGFTEIRGPNGAVGLELNGGLQSYSVARVGADGRPSYQCVTAASDSAAMAIPGAPALEER